MRRSRSANENIIKNRVLETFNNNDLQCNQLKYYKSDSRCADICQSLGMKASNIKNRKKVYYYFKKYLKNSGGDNEQIQVTSTSMEYVQIDNSFDISASKQNAICSTPLNTDFIPPKMSIFGKINYEEIFSQPLPVTAACQQEEKAIVPDDSVVPIETISKEIHEITPESFDIPKCFTDLSEKSDSVVIPLNSYHIDNFPTLSYNHCTILEGTFRIKNDVMCHLVNNNRLVSKFYPSYFRNRIGKFVNNVCTIIMKYPKYMKNGIIKIAALCKNNNYNCKKFSIVMKGQSVEVFSNSINFCHPDKITSCVKGIERALVKSKLLHKKPSQYKRQSILVAKKDILSCGNLQGIKSDCAVRKIKAEAESQWDRDKNDMLDLYKMQEDHDEYLKEVSMPFNVTVFSKEQLQVLDKSSKGNSLPIIFFDATGCIVRKPTKTTKRVFVCFANFYRSYFSDFRNGFWHSCYEYRFLLR